MICPTCGTESTSTFCTICGTEASPKAGAGAALQPQAVVAADAAAAAPVTTAVETPDAKNWAMGCHLSALLVLVFPFLGNLIGPLIIWLVKRSDSPLIDREGKESLNFQISMTLYFMFSAVLTVIVIGFPLMIAVALLDLILCIVAAIKTSNGEEYHYPLSLRFIS